MKSVYKYAIACILVLFTAALVSVVVAAVFANRPSDLPLLVWMYWDTKERPLLIQQIHDYNRRRLDGWTVRFLDREGLAEYIQPEEYPKGYEALKAAHQADWIRLCLLSKYGGVWMDASMVLNDGAALRTLRAESIATGSEFTGFSFKNEEPNCKSSRGVPLYVENWFMMAPKNSSVIRAWKQEHEKAIGMGFPQYRHELRKQGVDTHLIFDNETATYLTQHACLQMVLQRQFYWIPHMILLRAEDSALKLRVDCALDSVCTMRALRDEPERCRAIPYIKLIGLDRKTGIDISGFLRG